MRRRGGTAFNIGHLIHEFGRWLIKDIERQHFSPYLAMSNNPMHIDPNGLTDWRAAGEATLAIFGGIGETALGIGVICGSGGLATVGGAYLIADGGTRAIMGIPKLISALTEEGNVSVQARANPTNLGGLAGQILDEKTGNKHNYSKVLSITNDFVSLGATGGSGGNFQKMFSNGTRNMDEVMAYFTQGAIFYDIFNNGGVIDMIENRPFNPREHCPDCIILNEINIRTK